MPMKPLSEEPHRIEIDGRHLQCPHCSRDHFHRRRMRVELASPAGMQPEWHESIAHAFICSHCGLIQGFLAR